jgi:hypothetical protein
MCSAGARSVGKILPRCLVLGLGLTLPPSPAATIRPASSELHVTVYVFNSVYVSLRDLIKAEAQAARIFDTAGIKVTWVAGLTAQEATGHAAGEAWNPANLDLRIWTRPMARGTAIPSNALGYCLSMKLGQAVVLADAIQNLAAIWGTDAADILGLALAHEIGHLLLQTASHSAAGMMEPRYLQKDLVSAERGGLMFTRDETNSMRNEVRRRMGIQIPQRP